MLKLPMFIKLILYHIFGVKFHYDIATLVTGQYIMYNIKYCFLSGDVIFEVENLCDFDLGKLILDYHAKDIGYFLAFLDKQYDTPEINAKIQIKIKHL